MKQIYEEKKIINLCGILDKDEYGYVVTVEGKDDVETYRLNDVLDNILGQVISFKSEIF